MRLVVAADKGADIIECLYKPTDIECLWRSSHGLRQDDHLRFSSPLQEGHFREYFPGGWYEMLPNGPQPCRHRGAQFGHHGEATLLAWDYRILRDEENCIEVAFHTRLVRQPLRIERIMRLHADTGTVVIDECVRNESRQRIEFLWGHHPTFGAPLVEPGTRIHLPACTASTGATLPAGSRLASDQRGPWPHLAGAESGQVDLSVLPPMGVASHDFVRLDELADGWFALVNPRRQVGFALRWDKAVFPMLGLWQVWGGGADYPWYGMPHLLALEPACDLPSLAAAAERGTACVLEGGGELRTTLEATVFAATGDVTYVGAGGEIR